MKLQSFHVVVILALTLCRSLVLAQGPPGSQPKRARTPADYKSQTLRQVDAEESDEGSRQKNEGNVFVHGDLRPSRVQAIFAGRSRPLPQIKKAVLHRWAQRYAGDPEHYTVPYDTEILFKEDGKEYWLAVRKEKVAQFEKEFREGDTVDLFLVRLGGAVIDDKWNSLLLVESFQRPKAAIASAENLQSVDCWVALSLGSAQ
jgi:hypothetical protein